MVKNAKDSYAKSWAKLPHGIRWAANELLGSEVNYFFHGSWQGPGTRKLPVVDSNRGRRDGRDSLMSFDVESGEGKNGVDKLIRFEGG